MYFISCRTRLYRRITIAFQERRTCSIYCRGAHTFPYTSYLYNEHVKLIYLLHKCKTHIHQHQHLRSRYDFSQKPVVCSCTFLCAGISRTPKALESGSNPQKTRQVFASAMTKTFLVLGVGFFVSNVISGVVLGLFDPLHLTL